MNRIPTPSRESRLYNEILHLTPLAYYPLNEVNGSVAINHMSPRGSLNGTISGPAIGQPGKVGKSYLFDGGNMYVDLGTGTALQLLTSYSLGAIIRTGADLAGTYTILNRGTAGNNTRDYLFHTNSSGKLSLQRSDGSGFPTVTGNRTLTANTTYFVMATFDGTTGRLYVNGALDNSANIALTLISDAGKSVSIGRTVQTATGLYYKGSIQHVFLANKVYSDGVVSRLARLAGLN